MNLIHADCLDAMAAMDAESIDAIVTDPPYGIRFMGKAWDGADIDALIADRQTAWEKRQAEGRGHPETTIGSPAAAAGTYDQSLRGNRAFQEWCEAWAREAFRIAKPGAHLLAFGGTRTVHRLAAAIEDAGWEIRDMLVWGYASGFPKSLDVSKAIDKAAGVEREVVGKSARHVSGKPEQSTVGLVGSSTFAESIGMGQYVTAPATPDAEKWNGWGTALKPAWEPIVMARKPLRGTVAANVLRHGTGALNIDGTRIGYVSEAERAEVNARVAPNSRHREQVGGGVTGSMTKLGERHVDDVTNAAGRWPANVILTDPIFDGGIEGVVGGGETGPAGTAVNRNRPIDRSTYEASGYEIRLGPGPDQTYGDSGTYSRFFLIPKSARAEREPVLNPDGHDRAQRFTTHPTVKPLDLMRHLVRLVTPPGGTVLDPFLGSGTTALACEMEGFAWIGIEKEAEYVAITEARLNGTQRGLGI